MVVKRSRVHNVPFPKNYASDFLVFEKGEGVYLYDPTGKKYLDFGSGISVNALGHGREDLAQAAYEQMKKVIHTSNLFTSEPSVFLAEKLIGLGNFDAVHFGNSGSEANEAAIKYARLYSNKTKGEGNYKILAFENGFHGRTIGSLSCTYNSAYKIPFEPLVPGIEFSPYNDAKALEEKLDSSFAAVIVEVVQGEGGLMMMTEEFAAKLNELCRKYDIVLIADEVQTGLGRTGWPFASSMIGLEPDIISLAKPLAGGLPLSATLLPKKINDLISAGDHGSTFGGGPVTSAVAGKVLDVILNPPFLFEVQKNGEYLSKKLKSLAETFSFIGETRGCGMLQGLEIKQPEGFEGDLLKKIISKCEENGLIVLKSGKSFIRIAPPLIITEKEIDEGTEIMKSVLESFEL